MDIMTSALYGAGFLLVISLLYYSYIDANTPKITEKTPKNCRYVDKTAARAR